MRCTSNKKNKILSIFLVILFSFSLLPTEIFALEGQAVVKTPIIGPATATVNQMKEWARKNKATETFISLAEIYVELAPKHGGIDPVVAYAQSAKETGYGRFGGIIDETYFNPCGMKTTEGGADNDPSAHFKFKNWNDGISAHLDHLALYAGAKGYPKTDNTLDPRHFPYLIGKCDSVESLGGNWAPNSEYGNQIVAMVNSIQKTNAVEELPQKTWLEYPEEGTQVSNSVDISGWAINNSGIKEIKVYVNNTFVGNAIYGSERSDIKNAYPNYKDSLYSGFSYTLDTSNLIVGKHEIKIVALGNDGQTITRSSYINVSRLAPKMWLEYPESGSEHTGNIQVSGWALNSSGIKEIKAYIDGKYIANLEKGFERTDVNNAYPGYEDGINSGFCGSINIDKISSGNHTITVEQIGYDGSKMTRETTVNIKKLEPKMWLEYPEFGSTKKGNVVVSGWSLNASGIDKINIYIDGKKVGEAKTGFKRTDVDKTYPGYKNGANSGFEYIIDSSTIQLGEHVVKAETIGIDGSITSRESKFTVEKLEPRMWLEYPEYGSSYTGDIGISGWALNASGVDKINIHIDGKKVGEAKTGFERMDVDRVYPGYKNGTHSGFEYIIDISNISKGTHTVKVESIGVDGSSILKESKFVVEKPEAKMWVETPESGATHKSGNLTVSGWAVDSTGLDQVKIFLNGYKIGNATIGYRSDVANAYPNYKDSLNSGFSYEILSEKLKVGQNDIIVEAVGKDGTSNRKSIQVNVEKLKPKMWIEYPDNFVNMGKENVMSIGGWAINYDGVEKIEVHVDGKNVGTATIGLGRDDVASAYPEYKGSDKSGFTYKLDLSTLRGKDHILRVKVIGKDGTVFDQERKFSIGLTVMIDPGHGGKDPGALSMMLNNQIYKESELTLKLSLELKKSLESKGFNVLMTRDTDKTVELSERAAMANDANVDFFLSIHHDSYVVDSANGVTSFYSTWRPNLDTDGVKEDANGDKYDTTPCLMALESQKVSSTMVRSMANAGFYNRGSKQRELYVTTRTNMPSLLLECGFVTNKKDLESILDSTKRKKMVDNIANEVYNYLK